MGPGLQGGSQRVFTFSFKEDLMVNKLTEEEKLNIVLLRKQGKNYSMIAGLVGRSADTVKRVLKASNVE